MKIFDMHADIGFDVLRYQKLGMRDVLLTRHADKCLKGEISNICMACYFVGNESWEDMQEMVLALEDELNHQDVFHRVLTSSDLDVDQPLAVMSIEGMCGIQDNAEEKIQWLYDHGIRMGSLCWNEHNALACGTGDEFGPGLSELGRRVIQKMDELHMIIDVSHANIQTMDDILELSTGLVVASHSNSRVLSNHRRNLTDEQARKIASKGGLIGLNAYSPFIDLDYKKVRIADLATHAKYLSDLVGIDHIACGFDLMDYFGDHDEYIIEDFVDASMGQNFVNGLREVGFSEEEVEKICFKNVLECFKNYLR